MSTAIGTSLYDSAQKLNPRNRHDIVKDSVYGYIRFTYGGPSVTGARTEKDLIDSPWVQRLRRLRQLQGAWFVYPSADHTRFVHALSVMELAGRFARALYTPYWHAHPRQNELPSLPLVVETLRIAGLLHDIGHGPFSHLLDTCYFKPNCGGLTHEKIGAWIIRERLAETIESIRSTPDGDTLRNGEKVDPDLVSNLVDSKAHEELPSIWRPFGQIISGAYDADKMDFVLRDGKACGLEGIPAHEVERLIDTSFLAESDDGLAILMLDESSFVPLCLFLRHRQHLHEAVYYHRTVRALEHEIRFPVAWAVNEVVKGNPLCDAFLGCDESDVHVRLTGARDRGDAEARRQSQRWDNAMARRVPWKLIHAHEETPETLPPAKEPDSKAIKRKILSQPAIADLSIAGIEDKVLVDIPRSQIPKEIDLVQLHNRRSGRVRVPKLDELFKEGVFRYKLFFRVYVHQDLFANLDAVTTAVREILGEEITQDTSW